MCVFNNLDVDVFIKVIFIVLVGICKINKMGFLGVLIKLRFDIYLIIDEVVLIC